MRIIAMRLSWILAVLMTLALPISAVKAAPRAAHANPSNIPADLHRFVADFNAAIRSRDLDHIMSFYSDRYLQDGRDKTGHRAYVDGWIHLATDFNLRLTHFQPVDGERAYIAAIIKMVMGTEMENRKHPDYQIVKEDGQWRWLGNQKKE